MSAVESVQEAVVAALNSHAGIAAVVSGIYDGPPPRAAFPYISMGDGITTDWSTKTARGRELRVAITVWDDGDQPARLHALMAAVDQAMNDMPRDLSGWRVASLVFLRSFVVRDSAGPWAGLVEHRIRVLES